MVESASDSPSNEGRDPSRPGEITTRIGNFADVGRPGCQWTVTWNRDGGEVVAARRATPAVAGPPLEVRTLARVPTVDYVHDILNSLTTSRAAPGADQPVSFERLARRLAQLNLALWDTPSTHGTGTLTDDDPFYLDYGHTYGNFDASDCRFIARELWDDLEDNAASAGDLLQGLIAEFRNDGSLASATSHALELVATTIAIYIALQEAYRTAHQTSPGPQTGRSETPA